MSLTADGYPIQSAEFIPFTAQTRMSGINLNGDSVRKGAPDSIIRLVHEQGGSVPGTLQTAVDSIARTGGTPLAVVHNGQAIGVVHLKDVIKPGMKERFMRMRAMGIKTVMITGDNPLTATAIAAEAGVDDFLAEATPEAKLKLIRQYQAEGRLVAMTGDGANDVAKYFAIIPAAFAATYPALEALNFMGLATPQSAILSAVIFNALVIIALVPLALRGVPYRPLPAAQLAFPHQANGSLIERDGVIERIAARIDALEAADPNNPLPIPVDLVTASGSGLDPHISPAAAEYQVEQVARVRGLEAAVVRHLVAEHTDGRTFGLLGEPRVNVLDLNLALDQLQSGS